MDTAKVKKYLPIVLVVVLVIATYSTASALLSTRSTSAQNRPQPVPAAPQAAPAARPQPAGGSGCTGLTCYGSSGGGYGNHTTGRRGSQNNLSGYNAVRFDVFRPDPNILSCNTTSARDMNVMRQLGILGSIHADRYIHYRVAASRATGEVIAGVQDSIISLGNQWYEANTGQITTEPQGARTKAPTHTNAWIGPDYIGEAYCLPLSGGDFIREELNNRPPEISILHNGQVLDFKTPTVEEYPNDLERLAAIKRAMLNTDNLTLRIVIQERAAQGAIDIRFEHLKEHIRINVGSVADYFQVLADRAAGTLDEEKMNEIWKLSTDPDAAIQADVRNVQSYPGEDSTVVYDVPLKIRAKGPYLLNVSVNYQAFVDSAPNPFTGLSGSSNQLAMNIIAAKSVNR